MSHRLTEAQQRALREAEDTPHGLRLRAQVHPSTAASLVQAQLCTPPVLPPGRLLGEAADPRQATAHWLTVEGIAARAALRSASDKPAPTQEDEGGCAGEDVQGWPCDQEPVWLLSWQHPGQDPERVRVCAEAGHLSRAVAECAARAAPGPVRVAPVEG